MINEHTISKININTNVIKADKIPASPTVKILKQRWASFTKIFWSYTEKSSQDDVKRYKGLL